MRIGVTAVNADTVGMMDRRLGHAPYVLVFDTRSISWEIYENKQPARSLAGAELHAAKNLASMKIGVLITGEVEEEGLRQLNHDETRVYCVEPGIVKDVLHAFLEGHYAEFKGTFSGKGNKRMIQQEPKIQAVSKEIKQI